MKGSILFLFLLCSSLALPAQNTVGLIQLVPNTPYEGYNLIFPHNQSNVYLFDNCGQLVHSWTDDPNFRPGNAGYLLENGQLIKCKRHRTSGPADPIWAGGGGETVEVLSWDNQLLYSFELNDSLFRLHHDVAPMPNGHILMIVWAKKTKTEALQAGRDPATMADEEIWSEQILEWDPVRDTIVWRWDVWDHLVQDYDAKKDNFGPVDNHPERIDINFDTHDGHRDWLHANAIDYNPVLDQIVLSVPYFNEFWVIDHSTTTEEAAGHSGGQAGHGGDLIYRWGNPAAYRRGDASDQRLFFQHDIHWVRPDAEPGTEYFGYFAAFNNRVSEEYSSAVLINPSIGDVDPYEMDQSRFLPENVLASYTHPDKDPRSFSTGLSSVQFLPNGHVLVCSGRWGLSYELNPQNEIVWTYITPIRAGSFAAQGDTLGINDNLTFRLKRYSLDYPAFSGRDLSPKGYLELNPDEAFCLNVSAKMVSDPVDIKFYPNPVSQFVFIELETPLKDELVLYNLRGQIVKTFFLSENLQRLDLGELTAGMYILKGERIGTHKIVCY